MLTIHGGCASFSLFLTRPSKLVIYRSNQGPWELECWVSKAKSNSETVLSSPSSLLCCVLGKIYKASECNLPTTQKILSDGRPTNLPCNQSWKIARAGQQGNGASPSALLVVTIKARYAPLSIRGNFQWQHWLWLYAVDAKPTSNAVPFANLFISPPLSVLQAKPLRQLPCWC